jgi:putative transposase
MAHNRSSHVRDALTRLISPQRIRRCATSLGAVKRRRKVDIVSLVYTLVLGFDRGAERTLASLRRAYASTAGVTLAPSAFYDRFTPALAELMRALTVHALRQLSQCGTSKLERALSAFAKVFIADGSLIRLSDALASDYPSVWTNHTKASIKLHVVMNGVTRTPEVVRVAAGSRHDLSLMSVGAFCRGTLLIFDLAYIQGKLFRKIVSEGGHFLCRVKKDANFRIVAAEQARWVGLKHQDILSEMHGKSFEAEIDYEYRHIPERDWEKRHIPMRLIASWHADAKMHRLYITSATSTQLSAKAAPAIYAMRWEVELLFRELKSQLRLADMPSGNKAATESLVYASVLALALGRNVHRVITRHHRDALSVRFPKDRWASVFRSLAPLLLELLLAPPERRPNLERRVRITLEHEAPDPNRNRLLLVHRAQLGLLHAQRAA